MRSLVVPVVNPTRVLVKAHPQPAPLYGTCSAVSSETNPPPEFSWEQAALDEAFGELGIEQHSSERPSLTYTRRFALNGRNPFDTVEWGTRDAVIKNHKGDVLFEQKNVEFPTAWSDLAVNIVASKYFHGDVAMGNGTPEMGEREYSLKQLINRVVNAIGDYGMEHGYFDHQKSRWAFTDDLRYLLVHQMAAFNSPVWFNVGLGSYGLTSDSRVWAVDLEKRADGHQDAGKPAQTYNHRTVAVAKQVDPLKRPQASACQPYRALVSTPNGMVPIGRLVEQNAVGHEVYDANGVARILAVHHNGVQLVYRIQLRSGNAVEATADHLVYVSDARGTAGRFVELAKVQVGDRMSLYVHRPSMRGESLSVSEAALAGWLLSDGYVGKPQSATSLTVEYETINDAERAWVRSHNEVVFPDVKYHEIAEETEGDTEYVRFRAYGERFRPFVEKYGLMNRRLNARVPELLFDADLDAVRAFLRSVFESDGYVSLKAGKSKNIGYQRISRELVEGVQRLLLRFGIFARLSHKGDPRENRHDGYALSIGSQSEIETFAREVGFISPRKQGLLSMAILRGGKSLRDVQYDSVVSVEMVGVEDVYDIQTESGEYLSGNIRVHDCSILSAEDNLPVSPSRRQDTDGASGGGQRPSGEAAAPGSTATIDRIAAPYG